MTTRLQDLARGTAPQTVMFLLLCSVMWVLVRPYDGLVHDSQLYALQTLATLQPDIFGGDIFLRFGSQNDFTLFPRLYALLVREIGVERAAASLTLCFSLLWLTMGWRIARRLSNGRMAWLALGLLISVSAWYGAYHVFRSGEMFLAARLPAEVFSLAAIAAFLDGRRVLAGGLVLVSGMLHPLMAMPVALLFVCMLAEQRWGVRSLMALFLVLIFGGTAATLALSGADQANSGEWLLALQTRSLFLFPVDWRLEDWQHSALMLSTIGLAYGAASSETLARFASSMLLVAISGIGLAAIAGALPQHEFLLKIQPWRWLWPAVVAALILLPGTVEALWREGSSSLGRTCAILLVASWMLMDTFGGMLALATLCIFLMHARTPNPPLRALRVGAWLVLAATFTAAFVAGLQCALYPLDTHFDPRWIQRMVNGLPTNSTAAAAILVCWLVSHLATRHRLLAGAGILLAAALLVLVMPRAHRTWTTERFPMTTHQVFAPWRAIIPETSEVLWPENATGVWILMERRSYLSTEQLAGLLYSPELVAEMTLRAEALKSFVDPGWWTMASLSEDAEPKELTPELLSQVCRAPGLDYLVDRTQIEGYTAKAMIPVNMVYVYLYDCRVFGKPENAT